MNPKNDNRVAHYPDTAFFLQKQLRLERSGTLPIGVIARSKLEKDSNNEVRCSRSGACPAVVAGIGPVDRRKDRREFSPGSSSHDGGLRERGRNQRHV